VNVKRHGPATLSIIGSVLAIAGVILAEPSAQAGPAIRPVAANPVPILRSLGVTIPEGMAVGNYDVDGSRYASVVTPRMELVNVHTFADATAQQADAARRGPDDDCDKTVTGHLVTVHLSGVFAADGSECVFDLPASTVASRLGLSVITG